MFNNSISKFSIYPYSFYISYCSFSWFNQMMNNSSFDKYINKFIIKYFKKILNTDDLNIITIIVEYELYKQPRVRFTMFWVLFRQYIKPFHMLTKCLNFEFCV